MNNCSNDNHNFSPIKNDYFKYKPLTEKEKELGIHMLEKDRSNAYSMLVCSKCGKTREIVCANYGSNK